MNLIIDQNLSIIDKSLDNYSSVERNVKSIFKEISLERKETQKKINYCNIIIQNTNELLEQYFFQIENLKSDLQKAYDHSSNGAIITNLEQEQEEIISKMEETKSKMVQSYKIMKHLDLQIDNLLERENYFRDYSININKKIKDLVLLKNFLSVTRKQYELSLKLSSIDNQGKTLDSYLINSSGVINDLLTFNRAADDAFNKMNHYFSNDLDKLLSENVRSPKKRKYDSGNDIEKIKTDAEILITERRKKDFERISYFK